MFFPRTIIAILPIPFPGSYIVNIPYQIKNSCLKIQFIFLS
ncbi:hypothetical protein SpAn4DRAFT_1383 [Sporomusa ovata]|uniref:Uncharacterized protein n=1 Tax=Sporomusa ovata TaxID=2378 RepID=A0A0U1KUP3_9FIRM|nr:hypothetical protein SpAn4DRAFT_1383 [Sporomusa ovata]